MIYDYDMERYITLYLMSTLNVDSYTPTRNLNKLQNNVTENDLVFFANYRSYKAYDRVCEKTQNLFPSKACDDLIRNRAIQLKVLDTVTDYPLKREYIESHKGFLPKHPPGLPIIKYGINHQGDGKLKGNPFYPIKLYGDNVVFEEFVPNARGIRVFLIDDDLDNCFIIEQVNPDNWIRNDNPTETLTWHYSERYDVGIKDIDALIADAVKVKNFINHHYLAMDYAVSDDRIGFLEANHIPGTPHDPVMEKKVKEFFLKICNDYLSNQEKR